MKPIILVISSLVLSACGGSEGDGTANGPQRTNWQAQNNWQAGVFAPQATYKDMCVRPRSGLDINGDAFADKAGSQFDEKMWLRSWSNETYLWYDEIIDRNPNNFDSTASYFDILRTTEITPSGVPKDNFHFSQLTEEYLDFSQSGITTGYGINWSFISGSSPRDIRVASVEPNSSASQNGVTRGDRLIRVNNFDVINGNNADRINNVVFPSNINETNAFVFRRLNGSELSVTLRSGDFATSFVNNTQILDTDAGKVGYVRFEGFQEPAQTPLIEAFQSFVDDNATDLILDLRYNGGGLLAMSSQLAYMIAGPNQTNNRTFDTLRFNDKHPTTDPVTGAPIRPTPFYSRAIDWTSGRFTDNTLPTLSLTRVFVITTQDSCSASEALINGLRGIDVEVIQIGETTCGKPFGFYPTDNCGTTYFTIQFTGVNDKGFGEYADGFKPRISPRFDDELPGCVVRDDLGSQLGDTNERMLATAITRLETGSCPVTTRANSVNSVMGNKVEESRPMRKPIDVFDTRYRSILLENSIYRPIEQPSEHSNGNQ